MIKSLDDLVEDVALLQTPLTAEELAEPVQADHNIQAHSKPRYREARKQLAFKRQATPAKDEKVKAALALRIQGAKTKDVAELFGVSEVTIRKWTREGIAKGMAEEIRNQIAEKLLPKAAATYEDILNTSAVDLAAAHKGHEVKLKAARDIAKGLGVLRPESQVTSRSTKVSMGLDDYMAMRATRNVKQVEAEVIDVEAPKQEPE